MLQQKTLHFNEAELNNLLSKYYVMIEKVPEGSWKKELQETYNYWNKIWWELELDEEIYLFSEPF